MIVTQKRSVVNALILYLIIHVINAFTCESLYHVMLCILGYGYGTVPGGRWTIDTEGGHVVVSVSLIRNGYEYGRRSLGRFRIPRARDSGYEYGRRSRGIQVDH